MVSPAIADREEKREGKGVRKCAQD